MRTMQKVSHEAMQPCIHAKNDVNGPRVTKWA